MNTAFINKLGFELAYLSLLTQQGLKPLSRWEKDFDQETQSILQNLGLKSRTVQRSVQSGKLVRELVFSQSDRCLSLYAARFDQTPINRHPENVRIEGLLFGYPSCCVESYLAKGYLDNSLRRTDQRILFHWACPNCAITPALIPHYRKTYRTCRQAMRGKGPSALSGIRQTPIASQLHKAVAMATALIALGTPQAVSSPSPAGADPHLLPIPVSDDHDQDLLADIEETILRKDPSRPDENDNQKLDGIDLAQTLSIALDSLPTTPSSTHPYLVHNMAWGLETCQVCGELANMGFMEIVNPLENQNLAMPYIGKHFLEHGSFSYSGTAHSGRINVPTLQLILYGKGDSHYLPVGPDMDGDLLADQEELDLGKDPQNPDQDANQVLDGVDLAKTLATEIAQLPTAPSANNVYRLDFQLRGLERCNICSQNVNMGHLTVCNPLAQLYAKLPYIALHYMEHGSFSFAGDVHGQGREEAKLLWDALHSKGPTHLLPVVGDSDTDGLSDPEEKSFNTNANLTDTDGDGVPDGFQLARQMWQAVTALPKSPNQTCYLVDHAQKGLVTCEICGALVNMGYVEVINPKENISDLVPYLALHFMRHGSFAYSPQLRLNPRLLDLTLHGSGASHLIALPGDTDKDGLLDTEEAHFGSRPDLADSDGDSVLDGVALAKKLCQQIKSLPTNPKTGNLYLAHYEADCYAPCNICGESINCGHLEIVNSWSGLSLQFSYLHLHFMEKGSFAVSASDRLDPLRLEAILQPAVIIATAENQAVLRWTGKPGRNYQIFTSREITGPWTPGPTLIGDNAELVFTDTDTASQPQKFYKIVAW